MLKRQVERGGSVGDGGEDGELKIEVGEGRDMRMAEMLKCGTDGRCRSK